MQLGITVLGKAVDMATRFKAALRQTSCIEEVSIFEGLDGMMYHRPGLSSFPVQKGVLQVRHLSKFQKALQQRENYRNTKEGRPAFMPVHCIKNFAQSHAGKRKKCDLQD